MQKQFFIHQVMQNLATLQTFSQQRISLDSHYFTKKEAKVADFIVEIEQTAETLIVQNDPLHSEYYADRLLKQFDTLNKSVKKLAKSKKENQFRSSFHFSPRIHQLPPEKRLNEYRKVLRALNEKMSWLFEQHYNEENSLNKQIWQNQIAETEYRKVRCLQAIEDLEQELQFR